MELRPDREIPSQNRSAIPFQHPRPGLERETSIVRRCYLLRLECLLVRQRFADNAQVEDIGMSIIVTRLPIGSGAEKNIHIRHVPRAETHANADGVRFEDKEAWLDCAQRQAVALRHGPKNGGDTLDEYLDQFAS